MRDWTMIRAIAILALWLSLSNTSFAQQVFGAVSITVPLYVTGNSVGNTADTNEDILQTYTVPQNTVVNVGDRLRIFAGGTCAASTDTKNPALRIGGIGGTLMIQPTCNAVGQINWSLVAEIVKTGSNTQSFSALGNVTNGNASGTKSGTASSQLDTSTVQIVVTGKNSTSATANSITCQYFSVDLIKGPPS